MQTGLLIVLAILHMVEQITSIVFTILLLYSGICSKMQEHPQNFDTLWKSADNEHELAGVEQHSEQ